MTSIVNQPHSFTHSFTESLLSKIHACQGGPIVLAPQTAQRIVEELNFPGQRPVDRSRVQNRLLWLTTGRWSHAFSITLARLPDGRLWLVDGQHRLHAIVLHGEPVKVRIIVHDVQSEDEARALFAGFDRSDSVRTDIQMLNAAQLSARSGLSKTMTSALYKAVPFLLMGLQTGRGQWQGEAFVPARQVESKMDALLEWVEEAKKYSADIANADSHIKRKLMGAGCMAVALMTYRYQPERAHAFWHGIACNNGLARNDPRNRLIADFAERQLNAGSAMQSVLQPALAWNAFCTGRELKILRIRDETRLSLWGTPLEK